MVQAFSSAAALCLAWIAGGVATRAFKVVGTKRVYSSRRAIRAAREKRESEEEGKKAGGKGRRVGGREGATEGGRPQHPLISRRVPVD